MSAVSLLIISWGGAEDEQRLGERRGTETKASGDCVSSVGQTQPPRVCRHQQSPESSWFSCLPTDGDKSRRCSRDGADIIRRQQLLRFHYTTVGQKAANTALPRSTYSSYSSFTPPNFLKLYLIAGVLKNKKNTFIPWVDFARCNPAWSGLLAYLE